VREELTGQASGGTVTGQTPEPGKLVDKGSTVDLVIEAVSIEVPHLAGKNAAEAQQALKTAGLAVGEVRPERTGSAPGGTVLRLDPPEGQRVLPQTPVTLIVEAESVAVPRLIGQTLGEATETLRKRSLTLGQITQRRAGATPGVVLNQSPAEGDSVAPGSAVTLTVEQQTIQVPALTNLPIEQAARRLSDEGLGLGSVTKTREGKTPGTVLRQDPAAGVSVEPGRQVALVIEDQPPPAAQVYKSGSFTVRQTWSGDLDQGAESSTGADFWFEAVTATERYLVPKNNATMAVVGQQAVGRDGCAKASLSTARIPITSLPAGTHVCVRTSEGRYSEFTVLSNVGPSPGTLQIAYTTWHNPLIKPISPLLLQPMQDLQRLRIQ
jgi:beta-lactam-binding protein with PASTA domain